MTIYVFLSCLDSCLIGSSVVRKEKSSSFKVPLMYLPIDRAWKMRIPIGESQLQNYME